MPATGNPPPESDAYWMGQALALARHAEAHGEVPVGAIVVREGDIIGRGWNRPIASGDPTAHAEICALRDACGSAGNYRIPGATLYATLEPCAMCAGAMINARLARLVYSADDFRAGAVHSIFCVFDEPRLTHRVACTGGVLADDSARLLQNFFRARRDS